MFVKICGLREPEHVDVALEAGADAIGFVLTRSPRYISAERTFDLVERINGRAHTVAVFRDETVDQIVHLAEVSGVSAIQVHGHRSRAEISKLTHLGRTLIRAIPFDDNSLEDNYGENILLVDAPRPGSGEVWDYAAMRGMHVNDAGGHWMLAGGLTPGNVAGAIAAAEPWGVDVSSGVETAPGEKSSELIREFLAAAKA